MKKFTRQRTTSSEGQRVKKFNIVRLIPYSLFLIPYLAHAAAECDPATDLCLPFANPQGTQYNIQGSILGVLGKSTQLILGFIGVVAFVVIIFGAIRWMTAGGNQENIAKGRGMMVWAFLGLILAAASFVIVDFLFQGLGKALYTP